MLEIPALTVVTALLSLVVMLATIVIKISYNKVEEALREVKSTMEHLNTHKTIHEEWRKNVDGQLKSLKRRCGAMEHKVFGHQRQDDTPSPVEE